jgi:hypothetical protein
METPLSDNKRGGEAASRSREIESVRARELGTLLESLARVSGRTPEEVRPHLDHLLESLSRPAERPFHETASPEEWVKEFHDWIESHRAPDIPSLSDEAIGRESIYGERG